MKAGPESPGWSVFGSSERDSRPVETSPGGSHLVPEFGTVLVDAPDL